MPDRWLVRLLEATFQMETWPKKRSSRLLGTTTCLVEAQIEWFWGLLKYPTHNSDGLADFLAMFQTLQDLAMCSARFCSKTGDSKFFIEPSMNRGMIFAVNDKLLIQLVPPCLDPQRLRGPSWGTHAFASLKALTCETG